MTTFFGFAVSDSMFSGACTVTRKPLEIEEARPLIEVATSALNPSHTATITAMRERFEIDVTIPETPPRVSLSAGDRLVVMQVRGLPRLTDRHEYTSEEIQGADFTFALWEIQ